MKISLELTLSDDDVAAIAHFCESPEAWVRDTFAAKVHADIMERINAFREKYLAAKETLGEKYLNRAQRKVAEEAEMANSAKSAANAAAQQEAEFQRRINAAVQAALASRAA